jgi:hypothetical protein
MSAAQNRHSPDVRARVQHPSDLTVNASQVHVEHGASVRGASLAKAFVRELKVAPL